MALFREDFRRDTGLSEANNRGEPLDDPRRMSFERMLQHRLVARYFRHPGQQPATRMSQTPDPRLWVKRIAEPDVDQRTIPWASASSWSSSQLASAPSKLDCTLVS